MGAPETQDVDKLIDHNSPPISGNLPLPPSPMPPLQGDRGMEQVRAEATAALVKSGLGGGLNVPQSLHVQEELDKLSEMFPSMDRNSIKEFIKDQLKTDLQREGEGTFT